MLRRQDQETWRQDKTRYLKLSRTSKHTKPKRVDFTFVSHLWTTTRMAESWAECYLFGKVDTIQQQLWKCEKTSHLHFPETKGKWVVTMYGVHAHAPQMLVQSRESYYKRVFDRIWTVLLSISATWCSDDDSWSGVIIMIIKPSRRLFETWDKGE